MYCIRITTTDNYQQHTGPCSLQRKDIKQRSLYPTGKWFRNHCCMLYKLRTGPQIHQTLGLATSRHPLNGLATSALATLSVLLNGSSQFTIIKWSTQAHTHTHACTHKCAKQPVLTISSIGYDVILSFKDNCHIAQLVC